ncbi:Gp19/Gp15/Gp42 family protein [Gordonia sp. ABSL1-1]|uniref:Gp19/Gp15/Gp42 family protein n=1 Tax=Gordonia sp. ABSL1-1 TaxID=3053923 RepID=UPI002572B734|nr:Gp19/Gp15/Gp42 family protein [Gordonia sp. ABSL1-1]MDL9938687.1 Gp19/Gp15/Gp42 family protein [Gordonia sp. ABSL1-1]
MTAGEGAFLTSVELADAWRPLSSAEAALADTLLASVGQQIRDRYQRVRNTPIADDDPTARSVSIDVVKTAMTTGAYPGHLSYQRVEGPRSKTGTLASPGGSVVITDWHWRQLGLFSAAMPAACFDGYDDARY